MVYLKYPSLILLIALILTACQPGTIKNGSSLQPAIKALPDSAFVTVSKENVRQSPNGRVLGKLFKDRKIYIYRRVGNWLQFHNERFDSAYIWAPSTGCDYINLYDPSVYYNTTSQQFYPIAYFKQLFGTDGIVQQETAGNYQLFFNGLGLGSHNEIVLEVVTESTEHIQHGITLFINKKNRSISQVRVDFFRLGKGIKPALKKCNLRNISPSVENEGHLIWKENVLFPGLTIDLERKEWQSKWFSAVWFTKTE